MKKIIKITAIVLVVIIAALIATPFIYKDKIVGKVKEEANKNLNAKLNFGAFDLTLITSFPNLSFSINNLSIVGVNEFAGDTLTYIAALNLKLNIWDVIGGGQMKIKSVELNKPYINLIVLKNGKANYDIVKSDSSANKETGTSTSFKLALQHYAINNGWIKYNDQSLGFKTELYNLNHSGDGDFTQDLFILNTKTDIEKTTVAYGNINYLNAVKTDLKADIEIDIKTSKYTFKENLLKLNELALAFDGWVSMPNDNIDMDINWNINESDFKNFMSLIPGVYSASYKDVQASGKLGLNGFVKGTYNEKQIPAYALNLLINDGKFKYPSLPLGINNVTLILKINNPDGVTDHTVIDISKLHVELGSDPFDAHLHVSTPVSDANLDAQLKGTINLGNIKSIIPLTTGTELSGIIKTDLTLKGRYSAIEQKRYSDFYAAGTLGISAMNYKSSDYPATTIQNMLLTFNPQNVTLNTFDATVGKSDFKASGTINNLLAYYFKNEMLQGSFNLNSSAIDLNEFMKPSATSTQVADTAPMNVVAVPANIDFNLQTTIGKLIYDNMQLNNIKGAVKISNQTVDMQKLNFEMLDGTIAMSGKYNTLNLKKPAFDYTLSIKNADIQKTAATFNTVKKMAAITSHATGKYSTDLKINGVLDSKMQPDIITLNGDGKMQSQNVVLTNFEPINKLADALKMEDYKKLALSNLNISYEIKNGRVEVKPFETSFYGSKAKIQGSTGLDQSIDYTMNLEIPKAKLNQQAANLVSGLLSKANNLTGTQLSIPDPVKINVGITGTVDKPVIKTDVGKAASNVVKEVKQQIETKVNEEIDKQKQKAREESDRILKEANIKAQQLRDAAKVASDNVKKEGYAAADKFVKDAGSNPFAKTAAQEGAKKMKKETDRKSQQIIDEGNKKAQDVLNEAKKKSDELLK